jgi:transposase
MSKGIRHTREFKLQAAKLVVEQGYTISKAAERLGLSSWSVRDWVRQFRADGTLPPIGEVVPEAEELKRLRKELAEVRMERDILKKAMVYFAKDER